MFRRASLPTATALIAAALTLCPAVSTAAPADPRSLEQVRERIGALQRKIESDRTERDRTARELEATEKRVADAGRRLRELRRKLDAQAVRLRETERQRIETETLLRKHRAALAQQLRAAYVLGRGSQQQMLLNLDQAQTVGRMLTYYDYLQRAQFDAIARITAQAAELEALIARQQQEQAELERLRGEQEVALAQLQSGKTEREAALKAMKTALAGQQQQLRQLQEDERAIRKLIESVRKKLADLPPDIPPSGAAFTAQKGRLPWPVRGPLLARYGEAKADGKLSWNGHWISAAEGAPIRAVARGRVVYVGWMHRYGLIALVEHDGGYYTLYGHCQSIEVTAGDALQPGQTLGAAGSTGGYDRSGVYFEIRKGTAAINPAQWLAR